MLFKSWASSQMICSLIKMEKMINLDILKNHEFINNNSDDSI